MGKIVAIGGGELTTTPGTLKINQEIVRLTKKKHPKLLFIPTASQDSEKYCEMMQKHFGKKLGCKLSYLKLFKESYTKKELGELILKTDIIYVGGGNTLRMMRLWKKRGVDSLLKSAYKKGIVLCGLSAGANCWFKQATSDSMLYSNPKNWDWIKVRGLNLVNLTISPHHLTEKGRKKALIKIMKKTSGVAVALDDYCAIQIIGDKYKIITSKKKDYRVIGASRVYKKKGKVVYEKLVLNKFFTLKSLQKT